MGVYTRGEFVNLPNLRDGGSGENIALLCAPTLAWLLVWPYTPSDGYRGRWSPKVRHTNADDVRIVTDSVHDFDDMEECFLNITPGLLQSMRTEIPELVREYRPRTHDVQLVQRTKGLADAIYRIPDSVSATCRCGWKTGPIFGESREHVLELAVSEHVNE
jgi:hypothetical protein